ncbi:hypothetical protein E4U03_01475 [Rothia nasimurium]|uniref:Uncharacterized protein n=1 Tax=Rothia nasimurium TaxID=85336 RepID=A0A4Y9F7R4_9MICC|nr:hypothetical protein [Rothia nasimurium]MBF0807291.1 hypothetical protein [Rothia nasimurium]TFU24034.1 hypothetical protein E4U03_01475 [Rothia nasimurium]
MTQHTAALSSSPLFEKISQISARLEQVSPLSGPIPTVPSVSNQSTSGGTCFAEPAESSDQSVQPWSQAS